jgi:hypothetical protein
MSRLRQIVTYTNPTEDSGPSYLDDIEYDKVERYQAEAQKLLKLMHYDFPTLSNYKPVHATS